jgi:hypothetical protein
MTKEVKLIPDAENVKREPSTEEVKPEVKPMEMPLALDPAILAAINAAVVGSVKEIVNALKPATPAPLPPTQGDPRFAKPYVPPYEPYKVRLKGIAVQPGEDLRHVHPQIIRQWFAQVENRWKERMKAQGSRNGLQTSLTLTQGA